VPSDLAFKVMNATHRVVLTLSRGRYGWAAMNMPVLRLTTTGRTSGLPRSVMLTCPVQEGSTLVVVASRGGDDKPPAWLLNVVADPDVSVVLEGGPPRPMSARVATSEERDRLWPLVVADHTNYADYQKRTSREIALVLLEPAG
jgi:deazaflavin-dependent oxidoreductase (nitroreductase family)